MASPFPGMDPYLEQSAFWSSFHTRLIVAIANTIAPALRPHYYAEVETRSYTDEPEEELITGLPSTASNRLETELSRKERYIEIRSIRDDFVVTVIEVLSPANKRKGRGRNQYKQRRFDVLSSHSNFIEIDLLRGQSSLSVDSPHSLSDYYILVSIANQRSQAQIHSFSIEETLPTLLVPLKQTDEAVPINMQYIFDGVIERASYDSRIDYSQPVPAPVLANMRA